eukprot:6470429-Amphidinium_carterae.1
MSLKGVTVESCQQYQSSHGHSRGERVPAVQVTSLKGVVSESCQQYQSSVTQRGGIAGLPAVPV